jgi:tRNA modification GTPase
MESGQETIAAIATGAGAGGVGVIRVSGPRAIEIVAGVVGVGPEQVDRTVRYAVAKGGGGERIDDVLVFGMRAPRSFTGEDVAEIQGHGGPVNLGRLLRAVLERGARVAHPGEFSKRAFENGKLDLLKAEALLGVIEAGSERAWRIAQAQLGGALGKRLEGLEERARGVLAELEGAIDFPDEELGEQGARWLKDELAALARSCGEMVDSYQAGAALRNGIVVALVGATNVGKSSLLNGLVGKDRALVSATPGTTRDYLEAQAEWEGVRVTLVDTAGWREVEEGGEIERAGISLGRARAAEADVVLVINDGNQTEHRGEEFGRRAVRIRSKADLGTSKELASSKGQRSGDDQTVYEGGAVGDEDISDEEISTSVRTGQGLEEVKRRVLRVVGLAEAVGDGELLVTERQRRLAETAQQAFARGGVALEKQPRELVAYDIREGYKALMEMRGTEAEDRLVDEIFARFCIGK